MSHFFLSSVPRTTFYIPLTEIRNFKLRRLTKNLIYRDEEREMCNTQIPRKM